MAEQKQTDLMGTDARLVISDWHVLAKIIAGHATLIKDLVQGEDEEETSRPNVLSQREIEDAFNGPLQKFFKQKATAYAATARVRLEITMREDENLKGRRAKLNDKDKVPESIVKKTSISDLNKIQTALDQLTSEHNEKWEESRTAWNEHILQRLSECDLSLSEIEVKEFKDPEPISELNDRFVSLNIDLPKINKADMDFSQYLTLKADVTIQSALSRQHLPNAQSDIQRVLKQLKSDFSNIRKQEQQILEEQKTATNEVVANISW